MLFIRDPQDFSRLPPNPLEEISERSLAGKPTQENGSGYLVDFAGNPRLQDLVPGLIHGGVIQPLRVAEKSNLAAWILPGVTLVDTRLAACQPAPFGHGSASHLRPLNQRPRRKPAGRSWNELARDWAKALQPPSKRRTTH